MMKQLVAGFLGAMCTLVGTLPLPAAAMDAQLTGDTYISSTSPSNNFGSLPILSVGNGNRAFLNFDLQGLPADTSREQIAKATLILWISKVGTAGALDFAQLTSAWDESVVTDNTAPSIDTAFASLPANKAGQWVSIDVTNTVKQWVEYPASNYGLAIEASTSSPLTAVYLDSKENTGTSHPPRLEVVLRDTGGSPQVSTTGCVNKNIATRAWTMCPANMVMVGIKETGITTGDKDWYGTIRCCPFQ